MTYATRPAHPLAAAGRPQPATMPALTIPSRFCGPPGSGNGGYVCGRIAAYLDGPVTVTLRRPPPLATPLAVERGGESSVRIHHGRTLIAEAASSPGSPALEIPGPVCNGGSSHGGRPRALLLRSVLPCLLCLRDGAPARGRAADLPRTCGWQAVVGGAVDTGSLGHRRQREGPAGGGLGGAGLSQRDRRS